MRTQALRGGASGGWEGLANPGPGRARAKFELFLQGPRKESLLRKFPLQVLLQVGFSAARAMVEGPGCTLNGEKIQAQVPRGQEVTEVRGTALPSLHFSAQPHAASAATAAAVSSQVSC